MLILSHFLVHFTEAKIRQFFSSESLGNIGAQVLLVFVFWGSLWALFEEDALPPNGYIFNLLLIVVMAHICGKTMQLLNLPPLLGMIVIGFVINNRDQLGAQTLHLDENLTRILRHMSLVIVLIRAGLELDTKKLAKLSAVCLRLAFMPCIVETVSVALTAYYLLDFPMQWGFLLGFLLSAVSPAVIVPPILSFKRNGIGMDKGIPTLLIVSASIDDILSLIGFGVCLKLIFYEHWSLPYILFKVPVEPLIGVMTGILIGLILWYIPSADSSEPQKLFLLVFAGMAAQFVFTASEMRAAGPEACFVAAFVASFQWRYDKSFHRIENDLKDLWVVFQAVLFGLIGTEVRIADMRDDNIILGFVCLCIGVIMRFLSTVFVIFGEKFTLKEKVFIGFSWLPKATLQVAVSPIVLEMAKNSEDPIKMTRARLVIDIAFLAVLLTAPLGAIAISILGPKILNRTSTEESTISLRNKRNSLALI